MIPAFGLFWGAILLEEVITSNMIIGCGFILAGVALATGLLRFPKIKAGKNNVNTDF